MSDTSPLVAYRAWRVYDGRTTDSLYHMDRGRAKKEIAHRGNIIDPEWEYREEWSDVEVAEGRHGDSKVYVSSIQVKR